VATLIQVASGSLKVQYQNNMQNQQMGGYQSMNNSQMSGGQGSNNMQMPGGQNMNMQMTAGQNMNNHLLSTTKISIIGTIHSI
jgi:hypothetical protein